MIEIKIPLKRRTKNHLYSMYFGALSVGADITGGFLAMMCIQKTNKRVALIFKDFKYTAVLIPIATYLLEYEANICSQN